MATFQTLSPFFLATHLTFLFSSNDLRLTFDDFSSTCSSFSVILQNIASNSKKLITVENDLLTETIIELLT